MGLDRCICIQVKSISKTDGSNSKRKNSNEAGYTEF